MKTTFLTLLTLLISAITFAQTIETEIFASEFSSPVDIQNAGDDRLFIVEQAGRIKVLNANGSTNSSPFLNITDRVSSGGERGLLGLAFHPDYVTNGYFFVYYTDSSGDTQVSRFNVDASDPDIADPDSELFIFDVEQPFGNHNGGCLAFGPEGYLHIGTGDGGAGGDPGNRSQNLLNFLGKMLRLDIDNTENGNNYAIPADNPFIGNIDAHDEIWAYGLRNPWRFSFDDTTNELWIGDVGQDAVEEVNRVAASEAGLNYGWRCYEGNLPFNTSGCPDMSEMTFPVAQYPIPPCFCSVTGGYVYRGSMYSDIQDQYIFATAGDGMISTIALDNDSVIVNHGDFGGYWSSLGEDINKELYIADVGAGGIYKIKGGVLSVPSLEESISFTMFPNPASDSFQIKLPNNTIKDIEIFDLKGRVVFKEENILVSEKNISITAIKSGVYLVKVTSNTGKSSIKKLVIQ